MKLFITFKYTYFGLARSNRYFGAFILSSLCQGLMYFGLTFLISILPAEFRDYILLSIAMVDLLIKYNSPGLFTELILNFLALTQKPKFIAVYIVINILLYYYNIAVLISLLCGVDLKLVILLWSVLILNHITVFLIKLSIRWIAMLLSLFLIILTVVVDSILIISKLSNGLVLIFMIMTVFMFYRFLSRALYVK